MRKTITEKWLKGNNACDSGVQQWLDNGKIRSTKEALVKLVKPGHYSNASWLLRYSIQSKKEAVKIAIYAAGLSLKHFEDKYPEDKRPREAINAAKKWLKNPTKENRDAAAYVAYAAAYAAYAAAYVAAYAAAYAAYAADAAYAAAYAAYAAAYVAADAAAYAADAAAYAADAAAEKKKAWIKIINYAFKG